MLGFAGIHDSPPGSTSSAGPRTPDRSSEVFADRSATLGSIRTTRPEARTPGGLRAAATAASAAGGDGAVVYMGSRNTTPKVG